jgi:hypothetical protein
MIKKLKTKLLKKIFLFIKFGIEIEENKQRYAIFLANATIHSSVKI